MSDFEIVQQEWYDSLDSMAKADQIKAQNASQVYN